MPVKIFQLHKRSSYKYSNIQDKFAFNEGAKLVAIADGTTQSFRSDLWANILTQDFVSKPHFDAKTYLENIANSQAKYNAIEFVFSDNPAKAYLEKQKMATGATSTFLGMKFEYDFIEIIACGDSNVFIVHDTSKISTYPFKSIDDLDNNLSFINTQKYTELTHEELFHTKLSISPNDKIIFCTDALSRLLIQHNDYIDQIVNFKDYNDFFNFCISLWDAKKMQEDDITLVIVENAENFKTSTFIPAADFEFEKEKEYEFIPTPINDTEMNENKDLNEALRKEFYEMNGKINKLESIFKFLLIITVANLALNFYVSYSSLSGFSNKLKEQLKFRTITNPLIAPEKGKGPLSPKEKTIAPITAPLLDKTPVAEKSTTVKPTVAVKPITTKPNTPANKKDTSTKGRK